MEKIATDRITFGTKGEEFKQLNIKLLQSDKVKFRLLKNTVALSLGVKANDISTKDGFNNADLVLYLMNYYISKEILPNEK